MKRTNTLPINSRNISQPFHAIVATGTFTVHVTQVCQLPLGFDSHLLLWLYSISEATQSKFGRFPYIFMRDLAGTFIKVGNWSRIEHVWQIRTSYMSRSML